MTLEEVERRLRYYGSKASKMEFVWSDRAQMIEWADAIRAHRDRCVDTERVRAALQDEMKRIDRPVAPEWYPFAREIEALLPPPKSALEEAIEMVEERVCANPKEYMGIVALQGLLALLKRAKEETK